MHIVLDLQPQAPDVHIHDLQLAEVVPAPDHVQNLLPGESPAGVLHKHLHDGILHLGELDTLAVLLQSAVAGIEQEGVLPDLSGLGGDISPGPAEQRVHPGGQLRRGEGLCHIVVGTGHQSRHLVHLLGAGGQHNDADLCVGDPDPAADLKAVDSGQHDVQQRHLGIRILLEPLQCLLAGLCLDDVISGPAQVNDNETADAGLVFQNQNLFHSRHSFL